MYPRTSLDDGGGHLILEEKIERMASRKQISGQNGSQSCHFVGVEELADQTLVLLRPAEKAKVHEELVHLVCTTETGGHGPEGGPGGPSGTCKVGESQKSDSSVDVHVGGSQSPSPWAVPGAK